MIIIYVISNIFKDTTQKSVVVRRQNKQHLPWNVLNPYNTPLLSQELQGYESTPLIQDDISVVSNSTYASQMPTLSQLSGSHMPPPSQRSKRGGNP
jgi:hypothetical protein